MGKPWLFAKSSSKVSPSNPIFSLAIKESKVAIENHHVQSIQNPKICNCPYQYSRTRGKSLEYPFVAPFLIHKHKIPLKSYPFKNHKIQ